MDVYVHAYFDSQRACRSMPVFAPLQPQRLVFYGIFNRGLVGCYQDYFTLYLSNYMT